MKKRGKILIVDDNHEILIALKLFVKPYFVVVDIEPNPNLILNRIEKENYDIIILDMNFKAGISTGNEGIYWMNKILEHDKDASIILITAYSDIQLAVKAIQEGATDFIEKPWDDDRLLATILKAVKQRKSKLEITNLT